MVDTMLEVDSTSCLEKIKWQIFLTAMARKKRPFLFFFPCLCKLIFVLFEEGTSQYLLKKSADTRGQSQSDVSTCQVAQQVALLTATHLNYFQSKFLFLFLFF